MKKLALLLLSLTLCIASCDDGAIVYDIPNPPITKGILISKDYIPSTNQRVHDVLTIRNGNLNAIYSVIGRTPEMFVITIQTIETPPNARKIYHRSYYQVNATTFGELQVNSEIDVTNNPNIKNVDVW